MKQDRLKQFQEIYKRHGWTLRRILRRQDSHEIAANRDDVEIFENDIDAAWFSRSSSEGKTTWEIRSLEVDQYALCVSILDDSEVSEAEGMLFELEEQMRDKLRR